MSVSVVIGMQWGDEGKGKIIDILSKDYDCIVRFNGGDNAGHTIKVGDMKFGLHLIPSCVFYPQKFKVIGNGVVLNPETLLKEMGEVEHANLSLDRLRISDRAHLILPWHKMLDGIKDKNNEIGTTKKGIGPAYSDKALRTEAIRVCDLYNDKKLKEKIDSTGGRRYAQMASYANVNITNIAGMCEELYRNLLAFREKIKPYVTDTAYFLNDAINKKKKILLEGAQGTLLDMDHGTYPFVTSSNTTAGAAATGSGIAPTKIENAIGISKAYTTRVGSGPFPTELNNELGEQIRQKGGEFGTTTGRPRRCGWLDMVALKYACMLNGVNELIVTKLDVLDALDEIKICVAYEIGGKRIEKFPCDANTLANVKPVYKSFKGWNISERGWAEAKKGKKVPKQCREYVDFIKNALGVKIKMLSYGPERGQTILF